MKLFWYYVWHSAANQIRKMMQTRVLIFLVVCAVIGIAIGTGTGAFVNMLDPGKQQVTGSAGCEASGQENDAANERTKEYSSNDLAIRVTSLVTGIFLVGLFAYEITGEGKSCGSLFLPADVNLLFGSPLRPQAILLFRLMNRLLGLLFLCIYIWLWFPAVFTFFAVPMPGRVLLLLQLFLCFSTGKLLQMLFYLLTASAPGRRRAVRIVTGLCLAAAGAGYLLMYWMYHLTLLDTAFQMFNGKWSESIPIWGWLKAMMTDALTGSYTDGIRNFIRIVLCDCVLLGIVMHVPADFYEEAVCGNDVLSEKEQRKEAEQKGEVLTPVTCRDRDEAVMRDGMKKGRGADVFFYKTIYNRSRFALAGFFTRMSFLYLIAAAAVSLISRFVFQKNGLIPAVILLSVLTFYRSLKNPPSMDARTAFFHMIPEATAKKLFFSLISGIANIFLDLVPAIVSMTVLNLANPLIALAWLAYMLSVSWFATIIAAFIELSIPPSVGKIVKLMLQVIFIYCGYLPDAVLLAFGYVYGRLAFSAGFAACVNIGIGMLFFAFLPGILERGN